MTGLAPMRCASSERLMWITPNRIFYAGLLGAPSTHAKGAIVVYVALEGALRVRVAGGEAQSAEVVVVQPYTPYEIVSFGRHVLTILIEAETVDRSRLPAMLNGCGAVAAPDFAAHVRRLHRAFVAKGPAFDLMPADFDASFFGAALPAARHDPRIAAVIARLQSQPSTPLSAAEAAAVATLSPSRFLHLFRQEVGTTFRAFRGWKRARSVLHYVKRDDNLIAVALDTGYPDAAHFCRCVRQTYGLRPKDIFAGSRKLRLIDPCPPPARMPQ
ncbi:MAG: AraC family transcriptional regulator [Rubrivivax sp.]